MGVSQYLDPVAKILGGWAAGLNAGSVLLRLGLALLFAAAIGCERANKRHSAGLRTFILVSLASAMAMLLDEYLTFTGMAVFPVISPAAVIGVAIICTTSILYNSKSRIKGLTTAVGLWACGILGLALGGGFYTAALIGFVVLFGCLWLLPSAEKYLKDRSNHFEIHLELKEKQYLQEFIATIRKLGLVIDDIESNPAYANSGLGVFSILLDIKGEELKQYKTHSEIIEALGTLEYVSYIEELR